MKLAKSHASIFSVTNDRNIHNTAQNPYVTADSQVVHGDEQHGTTVHGD
jgi:hypothetical protein